MRRHSRRRLLLASLALSLISPATAQQSGRVWQIGILSPRADPASLDRDANFLWFQRGMQEFGYVESKNVRFTMRFAAGKMDLLPRFAADLVARNVDVIVTAGNQSISAAQNATTTIPIVIATSIDPVGSGFAKSLARPGGNITGLSNLTGEISGKHLEILAEVLPGLSLVAVLVNPTNSAHGAVLNTLRAAQDSMRVSVLAFEARFEKEIDDAFASMEKQKAGGVIVAVDGFFSLRARQIARLAANARLASIYANPTLAEAGGLLAYGQDFSANYHRAAAFVDKILKGAKPEDLPIEQSTKLTLVVNRKAARELGILLPSSVMLRADRIIE